MQPSRRLRHDSHLLQHAWHVLLDHLCCSAGVSTVFFTSPSSAMTLFQASANAFLCTCCESCKDPTTCFTSVGHVHMNVVCQSEYTECVVLVFVFHNFFPHLTHHVPTIRFAVFLLCGPSSTEHHMKSYFGTCRSTDATVWDGERAHLTCFANNFPHKLRVVQRF